MILYYYNRILTKDKFYKMQKDKKAFFSRKGYF